ncbi:alpha/beta fold hydrolase [Bacillus suaedae]|uniref:Alpha/beta hydrolase n=1 Tax=Halalkalibacter suaedae TaxID=2822140 RepID=A0A940WU26_9BACI|nr:alpha/beta hydrolase [Bacillus suaedae]MBP3952759.1 alpha/beta hydrolase [Bacillus suaedae]
MPYIETEHYHIYYEVHGEGQPIVFIHAPVMGHLTFRSQKPLAEHFQLIFIDLLDSGRSTKHTEGQDLSIRAFADIVYTVVSTLDLKPVVLCGYSNGGSIAQEFALAYPKHTAGLIMISAFPEVSSFLLSKEFDLGIWVAKHQWLPLLSTVLTKAHFKSKEEQKEMARFITNADGQVLHQIYERGKAYAATGRLKEINVPVLAVYGKLDMVTSRYMVPFVEGISDVEVAVVSGVAHQVPTRKPTECNQIIKSWISRKLGKTPLLI